jgi:hypothetical protein
MLGEDNKYVNRGFQSLLVMFANIYIPMKFYYIMHCGVLFDPDCLLLKHHKHT